MILPMTQGREIATDKQDWRLDALCQATTLSQIPEPNKDPFFLERGGKANKAKALCGRCDAKRACLVYALYYGEEEGIWGGLTPDERRDMPGALKELMLLEAPDLIDVTESRDPLQWLPIIFPPQRESVETNVEEEKLAP